MSLDLCCVPHIHIMSCVCLTFISESKKALISSLVRCVCLYSFFQQRKLFTIEYISVFTIISLKNINKKKKQKGLLFFTLTRFILIFLLHHPEPNQNKYVMFICRMIEALKNIQIVVINNLAQKRSEQSEILIYIYFLPELA